MGYLSHELQLERQSLFQESNRIVPTSGVTTVATTASDEWWGVVNLGVNLCHTALNFSPYASFSFSSSETDGYQEGELNGSGLSLIVDETQRRSVAVSVGFILNRSISARSFVFLPQLRAQYVTQLNREAPEASIRFVNDSAANELSLQGERIDPDRIDISLGANAVFRNGLIGFLEFQRSFSDQEMSRFHFSLGLRREL